MNLGNNKGGTRAYMVAAEAYLFLIPLRKFLSDELDTSSVRLLF